MNKLTPLTTSLVDAPPPQTIEGEKRLVKGEQGDLRRSEGEGGRSRAAEAGRRGRPEEREGERRLGGRLYGNREELCDRGEAIWCGQGRFF